MSISMSLSVNIAHCFTVPPLRSLHRVYTAKKLGLGLQQATEAGDVEIRIA